MSNRLINEHSVKYDALRMIPYPFKENKEKIRQIIEKQQKKYEEIAYK